MYFTNKFKKTALGLAVLGLAVATSAFTNSTVEAGYLTNNGTNYDFRSSVPGTCQLTSPDVCRYEIIEPAEVDASDSPFPESQIQDLLSDESIKAVSGAGIYQP